MKKRDIETYKGKPSVNVKCYYFPRPYDVIEKFNCDRRTAESALEYALESATESFWEDAKEIAVDIFGKVEVFQEGRSGGHLIVSGLSDIDTWNAIDVSRWARFERSIKSSIKALSEKEYILDMIESNQWYLTGSEKYNFFDDKNGNTVCIAELKKQPIDAVFNTFYREAQPCI